MAGYWPSSFFFYVFMDRDEVLFLFFAGQTRETQSRQDRPILPVRALDSFILPARGTGHIQWRI